MSKDLESGSFSFITPTQILEDDVPAFLSGSVTAIIGSSGGGKTSVLSTLSHRVGGGKLKATGNTAYNGNSKLSSIRSACVMQIYGYRL